MTLFTAIIKRNSLVVNAGNHDKDYDWVKKHLDKSVTFTDRSSEIAQLAIQGPNAPAVVKSLLLLLQCPPLTTPLRPSSAPREK